MPRTAVAVTQLDRVNGVATAAFASSDVVNGNTVPNDGRVWIELSNTDAASQTCTVFPARTVDGQSVAGVLHTLAAAAVKRFGPFPVADYSGQLAITCSSANLKVAAYRLPD